MQREDFEYGEPKIETEIKWVLVLFVPGQLVLPVCWAHFSSEQMLAGSIGNPPGWKTGEFNGTD